MKITQKICKIIYQKINVITLLRSVDRLSKCHRLIAISCDRLSNHSFFFFNARKNAGKIKKCISGCNRLVLEI